MHNLYSRVNNGSAFLSSCVMVLLAAIAASSFVFTAQPKGSLSVKVNKVAIQTQPRYPYKKQELAHVNFNITADLTPLFHWNTKQVFVYLQAEYTDPKGAKHDAVLWDRIVRRKEDAVINVAGKNKYKLKDPSLSFKNVPAAHYSLRYNLMPYVGALTYGEAAKTDERISFPKVTKRT